MTDPDTIEEPGIKGAIRRGLERFLIDLVEVFTGRKNEPKHAIDEILVYRLQNTIHALAIHYKQIIEERVKSDRTFRKELQAWFIEQGWDFGFQEQDYSRAARQTAYSWLIKYFSTAPFSQSVNWTRFRSQRLDQGLSLQKFLQNFFEEVIKIDYETIYSTDSIDQIAFPENMEMCRSSSGMSFSKIRPITS